MQHTESNPIQPEPWTVQAVGRETADTFTLSLQPGNGSKHSSFQPGQFSMLWVFGVGELPISISGDPTADHTLTYTVRSVGAATQALVTSTVGQQVGMRGPFGVGWPVEAAKGKDVLVMAGGIGLAPLRPVIYHVLRNRDQYGRLILLYGARSPRELLYRKELAAWSKQKDCQVLTTVDYAGMNWRGHVGVVTKLLRYARLQPLHTTAMMCGPEIMMRVLGRELIHRGLPAANIYLSMERNMKCAIGFCGHCQWGPHFICKDGPVFSYQDIAPLLDKYEL
jgi:NAD(P)H-flavin reductase